MRILILLFFPLFSYSQLTIGILESARSKLLLDVYPSTGTAFSLRKLSSSYAGSCIKVRRSSDNTEQDIGFVNNVLDTASLKTFITTNSAFVTIWYDQSGSGRNAIQATAASQPRIVNAGVIDRQNHIAIIFFDGVNDVLSISSQIFNDKTASIFSVVRTGTDFGGVITSKVSTFDNAYALDLNSAGKAELFGGGGVDQPLPLFTITSTNSLNTQLNSINGLYKSGTMELWVNNNQNATSLLTNPNNIAATMEIGKYRVGDGNFGLMYLPELIIYSTDASANRTAIELNINSFYTIY